MVRFPLAQLYIRLKYRSQEEYGLKFGYTELQISQVLHGRRHLTEKEKQAWAERLGQPAEVLFKPIEEFD